MAPVWRNGPDRVEVDPLEFVRSMEGADRWDMLLDR